MNKKQKARAGPKNLKQKTKLLFKKTGTPITPLFNLNHYDSTTKPLKKAQGRKKT